jgi:hypothetical protein
MLHSSHELQVVIIFFLTRDAHFSGGTSSQTWRSKAQALLHEE